MEMGSTFLTGLALLENAFQEIAGILQSELLGCQTVRAKLCKQQVGEMERSSAGGIVT